MDVKQLAAVANELTAQIVGVNPISGVNTGEWVSLGDQILSSETNRDTFFNTLADKFARIIIQNRAYSPDTDDLMKNEIEFGIALQKIYVDPAKDAQDTEIWDLESGDYVNPWLVTKNSVKQKIFSSMTTWEIPLTIPEYTLKTAFTSAEEFGAFISSLYTAVENSLKIKEEGLAEGCIANFIGQRLAYKEANNTSLTVVNLLKDYNDLTAAGLTTEAALRDLDFLKYASRQILLYKNRMKKMSVLFNQEQYKRHTPDDKLRIRMLADFTTAADSYLQSDTYHNEFTALPNVTKVNYWQASGQNYGFENTSKINVTIKVNGEDKVIEQDGIIGIMYDEDAAGITILNKSSSSIYNPRGRYTNMFFQNNVGYFNDLSENFVVFTIAEEPAGA